MNIILKQDRKTTSAPPCCCISKNIHPAVTFQMSRSLTIRKAARLIDVGLISCEELASFCHSLAVAGEMVWNLNAYTNIVSRDDILDAARESDRRKRYGESLSVFDGIPMSFKSNIAVKELPLTAGSCILGFGRRDTPPCGYDADTVEILLRDKGGILIGSTSLDEFGMGSLGTNSRNPDDGTMRRTKNPLPFLQHLTFFNGEESVEDDVSLASIIRLPHQAIMERHHEASESHNQQYQSEVYSAGGSSCGSAASVAHGSALLSLGTDTGGSIRLPAAWCGIVGLKPSYGLLSRHGIVSYASSFDTVGVLARSTDCAAAALDVLAQRGDYSRDSTFSSYKSQHDDSDNTPFELASEVAVAELSLDVSSESLSGIRVGIPASFSVDECPEDIRTCWSQAADVLSKHGAEIHQISTEDISPELVQRALSAYYVLVSAEASSNLSRYDGFRYGVAADENDSGSDDALSDLTPLERQYSATRRQGFGTEVSRRILCGTSVLSSDRFHTHYEAAAKLRSYLATEIRTTLEEKADVILIPTVLSLPHRIDEGRLEDNTAMFANDVMTVPASLSGLPAVSIPSAIPGQRDIFSCGLQLITSRLNEHVILKAAKVLENASHGR
jgi:aspartyl-tRNA(Asn)/glutamyl-tRNA(Gln) amidotransferase subunit A